LKEADGLRNRLVHEYNGLDDGNSFRSDKIPSGTYGKFRCGGEEMDEYQRIESEFAFLEGDKKILAVLLFGSGAKGQADSRSDRDFCVVAPEVIDSNSMSAILRKIYVNLNVSLKRYDIWLFEEFSLYMKAQVIENHRVVSCRDLPELYEYFYFYRKIWNDQNHRQELDNEAVKVLLG